MKIGLTLILLIVMSSCSLKEAADNDFKTKTTITPFAAPKKLNDVYGDKIRIKIPLSEDSVSYFELEDIIGDGKKKDSREKGFVKKFTDRMKIKFANLAIRFNMFSRFKLPVYLDFESIDPEFIKSAKVRKIFFTTEDCREDEHDCNGKNGTTSNFNFVDHFLINISNFSTAELETEMQDVSKEEFEEVLLRSYEQDDIFGQSANAVNEDFDDNALIKAKSGQNTEGEFNLVRFINDVPKIERKNIKMFKRQKFTITFPVEKNTRIARLKTRNYLRSFRFDELVQWVETRKFGIKGELKRGVTLQQLFERLDPNQIEIKNKMVILRINSKYIETKKFFEQDRYKQIIADTTMIGRSLYVELKEAKDLKAFERMYKADEHLIARELDIYKKEHCGNANCIDLNVRPVNLVPMLSRNPKLKIDSFITLKSLGEIDFKYNGFIEIEVDLSLPF